MSAAQLAEQATLGALLLDPPAVAAVSGWLRAEDFADPWHADVYTAIRELDAAHERGDAAAVGVALIDRHGYRVADAPRLLDLLQVVPLRPRPRHYAAMVLEGSLRRQVACQGVLLEAAALACTIEGVPQVLDAVTAQVEAAVGVAETRWALASRSAATVTPTAGRGERVVVLPPAVAADRLLTRHPAPAPGEVAAREVDLVACLIAHPDRVADVSGWLRPDALTAQAWRPVCTALLALHDAGVPIDVVTVAWEVTRGSHAHGPGPEPRELREAVEAASILDPTYTIRAVAADQLRATATRAAEALRTGAAHPGLDLRDLFGTTRLLTDTLRVAAERLDRPTPGAAPVGWEPSTTAPARLLVVGR